MEIPSDIDRAVSKSTAVGKGTFGTVFHYIAHNCDIAIKKLRYVYFGSDQVDRQMELLMRAQSDHVIKVFGTQVESSHNYILMEYMYGGTLEQFVSYNPLPYDQTKLFAFQLLKAVEYIHSVQIIHRNIKPSNILLDGQRRWLKLSGFSSASQIQQSEQTNKEILLFFTSEGIGATTDNQRALVDGSATGVGLTYLGDAMRVKALLQGHEFGHVFNYRVPGVTRAEEEVQVDIWCVGATMIHMRTGRSPIRHDPVLLITQPMQAVQRHHQLTHDLNEHSDSLDYLIAKLMNTNRPDATQALTELGEVTGLSPPPLSNLALDKALVSPYTNQQCIPTAIRPFLTLDDNTLPRLIESLKSQCPPFGSFGLYDEVWDRMIATECLEKALKCVDKVMEAQIREDKVCKLDEAVQCVKGMQHLYMLNMSQQTKSSVNRWLYCIECVRGRVSVMNV